MSKSGTKKSTGKNNELAQTISKGAGNSSDDRQGSITDSELTQQELALMERKIKAMGMQEELNRLRPLSGTLSCH